MPSWIVLKFGGVSVPTPDRWNTVAAVVQERIEEGLRPLLIVSSLVGVTDSLEELLRRAVEEGHPAALEVLAGIERRHVELGAALGLNAEPLLRADLDELSRVALAASLLRESGPALRARVIAFGEILVTRLGAAFLTSRGLPTAWRDARSLLVARDEPYGGPARTWRTWLSAVCHDEPDDALRQELEACPEPVVLTQGLIARSFSGEAASGETVLLGRGGADTSAAYLAARLRAARCEIWTRVPGMFTANPDLLPSARLLRFLDYEEAQEIAITGARVLHTRCIPPLRRQGIPLHIRWIERPDLAGTVISGAGLDTGPQVRAVLSRPGMTLVSMDSLGMLHEVGFLAEVFARFARHGVSIDSVSTSQTNVTVSLDTDVNALSPEGLADLLRDLGPLCEARAITQTASLSLVGRGIRAILHEIGPVLEVFEEMKVHLLTQSASDLNLTFVVDEDQSERLVRRLHGLLFQHQTEGPLFGPTWEELHVRLEGAAGVSEEESGAGEWWWERRADLLALAAEESPVYVYDIESLDRAAAAVLGLGALDRVFYSVKANHFPGVLTRLRDAGIGFECVSVPELEHVRQLFPDLEPERLLFTPNFAPREEYRRGFELGAWVTLDSLHPLRAWPELFAGREVFLRLDPGRGRGHHPHVRTAGAQSKFGIAPDELDEAGRLLAACGARVVGLHAHAGSGIRTSGAWGETAAFLGAAASRFPDVRVLNVGGGLGVPERPGQSPLDLGEVDIALRRFKERHPGLELWMEPGRFLVAQAGVLLARVVQVKRKGDVVYVGLETGMNSLIRPALYGAYHPIVNLSRMDEPPTLTAHIVGPICETGDVLGRSRRIAPAAEGDVLLIANAGAYGRVMSSWYNLRAPAGERVLTPPDLKPSALPPRPDAKEVANERFDSF